MWIRLDWAHFQRQPANYLILENRFITGSDKYSTCICQLNIESKIVPKSVKHSKLSAVEQIRTWFGVICCYIREKIFFEHLLKITNILNLVFFPFPGYHLYLLPKSRQIASRILPVGVKNDVFSQFNVIKWIGIAADKFEIV